MPELWNRISTKLSFWSRFGSTGRSIFLGALVSGITGFMLSWGYMANKDSREFRMWQEWYGPALSMACGHGYTMPSAPRGSEVDKFLAAETVTIDCIEVTPGDSGKKLSRYQSNYRYLIGTVGFIWKFTGPDWEAVKPLISWLYAIIAVAGFVIARAVIGTFFSVAAVFLFLMMPENIEMVTRLRDLAKIPFILLICAALLWPIRANTKSHLQYALAIGCLIGVGFGFRPDVVMMFPLSIAVLFLLGPVDSCWQDRSKAVGIMTLAALITSGPILLSYLSRNNLPHVTILGLSDFANYNLGVQPGSYLWGINHEDVHIAEAMNAYGAIEHPEFEYIGYTKPEYAIVGMAYLVEMLRLFPGDIFLRIGGAAVSLTQTSVIQSLGLEGKVPLGFAWTLAFLWLSLAGVFAISWSASGRRAVGFGLIYAYLVAVVALQFDYRHYFHVELFSLIALLVIPNPNVAKIGADHR